MMGLEGDGGKDRFVQLFERVFSPTLVEFVEGFVGPLGVRFVGLV